MTLLDPHVNSVHAISEAERQAFIRYINDQLQTDPALNTTLPLPVDESEPLFTTIRDGIVLWYV